MKDFIVKNLIAVVLGGAFVASGIFAGVYIASHQAPSFTNVPADRGAVVASLDESGMVKAEQNSALSFQTAGQIAHVYVKEGQVVAAGALLADLERSSLSAALDNANAKLAGLLSGTRPEQIDVDRASLASAQQTLMVADFNAYASADDAIHNQIDVMFLNPRSNDPQLNFFTNASQATIDVNFSRPQIETALTHWYSALSASSSDPLALANTAAHTLAQIQTFLNLLAPIVNAVTPATQTNGSLAFKANVITARTEVNAAATTLASAMAAMTSAQNTLTLAQSGATSQDIAAQQAVVRQAQAALNHAFLVAPFSGSVQNLTAQVGQVVNPGVSVLSVVNPTGLKIEIAVSQADVAKLHVGDQARVTLDAFGTSRSMPATVTTIAVSTVQLNGTAVYPVTLHFTDAEPDVRDGMTGNVHVILASKQDVVKVPSRLIINNNNQNFVLVRTTNGTTERRQVEIGLAGSDGTTEILSGLGAGDQLMNY